MSAEPPDPGTASPSLAAVIVGAGPAGLSLLLAARKNGVLQKLLSSGIRIIEQTANIGPGDIGSYMVRSDSLADSFLKAVDAEFEPPLRQILQLPAGRKINSLRGNPVPLSTLGRFLADMGAQVCRWHATAKVNPFVRNLAAIRAARQRDGSWITTCRRGDGATENYHSRALVIATGAHQPLERLFHEEVAGAPLLPQFAHKTVQSADLLRGASAKEILDALRRNGSPRVAIVGGSHSAIACAGALMQGSHGLSFGTDSIAVLHRRTFRLTYASVTEARSDGYDDFCAADICPRTGRVFPLAGLRSDSREILRRYWSLGGLKRDDRLRLVRLEEGRYDEANKALQTAHLIVAAMGYRPRALALFDEAGLPVALHAVSSGAAPLVDGHSRVLDSERNPVPGVFAIGLSAGYPLAGLHGEASFSGQANGLALWQSEIGEQIVLQLLGMN